MLKYQFRALGLALCWALACGSASVCAAVFTVDDSASSVLGDGKWRWRSLQFGSPDSMTVDSRFSVHAVLNTQPWVGKPARIYMLLAPQPTRLSLQWTTRGTLLAGRIEPGQRVLVFDGTVTAALLRDQLEIQASADGRELRSAQRLRVSYEIEVMQ